MGSSTKQLTRAELAAAVHAIGRAAGQSAFSPGYQAAIGEMLGRAEGASLIDAEERAALERQIREGIPHPENAEAGIRSGVEVYGLSVVDGFMRARDRSRPLLFVTWTAHFLERSIEPDVSTSDLLREHLLQKDHLAQTLGPILNTVRENLHFYGPPEEIEQVESQILKRVADVLHAGSDGAPPPLVLNLSEQSVDELGELAGNSPVDAIVIPPIHRAKPTPPAFESFATEVLDLAPGSDLGFADIEVGPALVSATLPVGSRVLWFGNQVQHSWRPESRPACFAARRRTLQSAETMDVVHFPDADGEDRLRCVPLGGHTLFLAQLGPGHCKLRVERARSWVDWFVRLKPERTWDDDARTDAFVAVDSDEEELPWDYELFSPQGRAFRRQFLPFGAWVRLGTLGEFRDAFFDDERSVGKWWVEEPDEDYGEGAGAALPQTVRVRALDSTDIEKVRTGGFDPDPDIYYYRLAAAGRDDWQEYLLKEGDLVFGGSYLDEDPLSSCFAVVNQAAAGTIGVFEEGVSRFVFHEETPEAVRRWTVSFLQSPLGDQWARALKYDEVELDFFPAHIWPDFLIPLPAPHWLNAYDEAETAVERLGVSSAEFMMFRDQVFEPDSDGRAAWGRLGNIGARAAAVNLLLGNAADEELTLRFLHPYPLANGLRRVRTTVDPDKRIRRVAELGELTARTLVGFWLVLEQARPDGFPDSLAARFRRQLRSGFTFGGVLHLVQHHLIPRYESSPMAGYLDRSAVETADQSLRTLNELRNDLSHLRFPNGQKAREALKPAEAEAMKALAALEALAMLKLVRVEEVDADPVSSRCRRYAGRALAGDHPAGWPIEGSPLRATIVLERHLYLKTTEGAMHPAAPMFALDPEAPELGFGMIDRVTDEGVRYRSADSGRTWVTAVGLEHLPGEV